MEERQQKGRLQILTDDIQLPSIVIFDTFLSRIFVCH
jgi:hypothetical protein